MRRHADFVCRTALVAALGSIPVAGAWAQQLVANKSEIGFVSHQMGVPVEGSFRRFEARVAFDPKAPQAAHIGLTIDLASVSLGAPETEAELVKPEWFGAKAHPTAGFESTQVTAAGPARFSVAGKLTIKGVTRAVVVPVALTQAAGNTVAVGTFAIKRRDFQIGQGEWDDVSLVADNVEVKFKLALTGVAAL